MKKRFVSAGVILSLIGIMALPSMANSHHKGKHQWNFNVENAPTLEIVSEKTGVSVEELLEEKLGSNCFELFSEYGLTAEEIREMKLENRLNLIDQAVVEGKITEEEAVEMKEKIAEFHYSLDCKGPHRGHSQRLNRSRMLNKRVEKGL